MGMLRIPNPRFPIQGTIGLSDLYERDYQVILELVDYEEALTNPN